ncbi:hypothetical protein LCGC14_1345570 [marine sediment metagenome]|uniref:HNH domain-containing protein n=1 Tax=marine sediment metagenome TaxID=412755 RepID=A0A0F9NEU0_9ZZZZ
MTYSEKLKNPKWQKKRLSILNRDKWRCQLCKDEDTTLHVHHLQYTADNIWDEPDENLQTLCEHCHDEVELLKKEGVTEKFIIYKSNNWQSGNRIMFTSFPETLSMRIYGKDGNYIVGYDFCDDLKDLKRLITNALK